MKTLSRALFVFSAASIGALVDAEMSDSFSCAPIQANVHDKLRCRESSDADGRHYTFDSDCCSGADYSSLPGRCANGFTKTETKSCGHGHDWCDANGCRSYTCEKSVSCVEYVGCFNDQKGDPALPFKASNFPPASAIGRHDNRVSGIVSACSNYCRKANFSLAAVQGDNTCRCGDGNLYNKYGPADARMCGFYPDTGVAQRCGDGDDETCVNVNAVYRLTGTEFCCEYNEEAEEADLPKGFTYYFLIGPIVATVCALFWTLVPCAVGACIWCSINRRKRAAAATSATMTTTQVTDSTPQPPVNAVMVTVMDPATQKSDVVVAQSAANPAQVTL